MKNIALLLFTFLGFQTLCFTKNPIIPKQGANDPHIRIFNGKAYLSASHDKSIDNKSFIMEDWWLWSSDNLVDWKLESVLKPEQTYIGKPFSSCWATDIAFRNGKYYWYFSEGNQQTGVVVGDSPSGPWKDPLGKPLLTSEMTPTHEYDMAHFSSFTTNGISPTATSVRRVTVTSAIRSSVTCFTGIMVKWHSSVLMELA